MRNLLDHIDLLDKGLVHEVHLVRRQRRQACRRVISVVDIDDAVKVDLITPIIFGIAFDQDRLLAHRVLLEQERASTDRVLCQITALFFETAVHDSCRIVVEVLGNCQLWAVEMEPYRVVVNLFNGTGHHALGDDRFALIVFLTSIGRSHHRAKKTQIRRTGLGIQPACEIEHDIVGVEFIAIRPLYTFA